ncbi:MAG TPA: Flp pilus assembly protein CpaB [Stellaceae bacterium]|jgi:pilus assembly protein CpaB
MIVRVILLLLGLVSGVMLAAAAFYGVFGPETPKQQATAAPPPPPPPPQTMVVVAARAIPTGTLITPQDLRFAPLAAGDTAAHDYLRSNQPNPKDQQTADRRVLGDVVGGVSRVRFDEGAPIARGETVKPGDAGFLAAVLRPGMRAITVSVNIVTGNNGLLAPGDHVDVVLTQVFVGHDADPGNRTAAEIIAADLRVIAVDQRLLAGEPPQKDQRPAQTVTLEVSALQAEQISVGAKMGEMGLAIRGVQADLKPGTKPGEQNTEAPASPPIVWAKDVSHAAGDVRPPKGPPPGGKGAPVATGDESKPAVRVLRGEKVESVVLP